MDTQPARGGSGPNLDRPALDEAQLRTRPGGRQLVIDRGGRPEADEDPPGDIGSGGDEDEAAPPTRGRITHFSEDARRRLRRTVHAVQRDADALFLSLTWHEHLPSPQEAHAALDRFWKRMRRRFHGVSAVWKMEPQDRGFPHFHLLVYGLQWVNPQYVSRQWHECTNEVSEAHRKSGVDVEWVRNDGKLQGYLSKYFSKTGDPWPEAAGRDWEHPGRFWGVLERSNLPLADWADWGVYIEPHEAARLIRELLDEWGVDTGGALPPTLTINTRGDPEDTARRLLDRLG